MVQIELEQASDKLEELIKAAMTGESVYIAKDDAPIIKLVPVKGKRQFGSAKGLIKMADDFDEPLEEFKEYMP
jgi:antitoxin (DNA-binding transcriptional repressor) of toxin-antitoxin stability system